MWKLTSDDRPILRLRISSKEQKVFDFLLDRVGPQGLETLASVDGFEIERPTQQRLRDCLQRLIRDPEGEVDPEGFRNLGRLLHDLILPDSVQEPLQGHTGPIRLEVSDVGIPWELLHDGQSYLSLQKPMSRYLPEGRFVGARSQQKAHCSRPIRALIVADPEGKLPSAAEEAEELRLLFQDRGVETTTLIGPEERLWDRILGHLQENRPEHSYHIIHMAGHVGEDPKDKRRPFGAFILSAGSAISPKEVIRVFRCPEAFVFINACRTHGLDSKPGTKIFNRRLGQARSLVSAFLGVDGCQGVIGTMWWVVDEVARGISLRFYSQLLSGLSVGDALLQARQEISTQDDPALWASYIHYGEPRMALVPCLAERKQDDRQRDGEGQQQVTPGIEIPRQPPPTEARAVLSGLGEMEPALPSLDESARLVMVNAFSEQQEMQWPELSSIHVLMGMLQVPGGATQRLLEPTKIPPTLLTEALRDGLKIEKISPDETGRDERRGGIRSNVVTLLAQAEELAKKDSRDTIGEADLLDVVLTMPESGAYLLLDSILSLTKNSLKDLAALSAERKAEGQRHEADLTEQLFRPNGELNPEKFSRELLAALEQAAKEAGDLNWPDIRSPHLALGILAREDSRVAAFGVEKKLPIKRLITLVRGAFQQETQQGDRPRLVRECLSDNAIQYLRLAARLAEAHGSTEIEEKHLWRPMLEDFTGVVLKTLLRNNISPVALLPSGW